MNNSERYRLKALVCEKCSQDATDPPIKAAWIEIAIESHALASRAAQDSKSGDLDIE
jgi:hypothetical protein